MDKKKTKQYAHIKFTNAHNENIVAEIILECVDNFDVMQPYYNEDTDDWSIGKRYGYFWADDGIKSTFSFSYAGYDVEEADQLALNAFDDALDVLGKKNKIITVIKNNKYLEVA